MKTTPVIAEKSTDQNPGENPAYDNRIRLVK